MSEILKNKYVQLTLALVVGITIGAVFYPTSSIEQRVEEEYKQHIQEISAVYNSNKKKLTETVDSLRQENSEYQETISRKTTQYEQQIRELKSKTTEKTYKIVKPDGTIIEKTFKESEKEEYNSYVRSVQEEFDRKVVSIENKWIKIHKERIEKIKQDYHSVDQTKSQIYAKRYEEFKKEVNKKRLNLELGYTTNKEVYMHTSYTIWGPVFTGGHTSIDMDNKNVSGGLGLGLSF